MGAIKIKDKNKVFFTSDMHFGHFNIIELVERKNDEDKLFESAEEMNEYLINAWNEIIPEDAIVIDLGDFMFKLPMSDARGIIKRLNFKEIHFVKGNHGRNYYKEFENIGRKVIVHDKDIVHVIVDDDEFEDNRCEFQVCHYPLVEWDRKFKGAMHLYGHTHHDHPNEAVGSLHIGIDTNKLRPLAYQEILTKIYLKIAKKEL